MNIFYGGLLKSIKTTDTQTVNSYLECMEKCRTSINCYSTNFEVDTGLCVLMSDYFTSSSILITYKKNIGTVVDKGKKTVLVYLSLYLSLCLFVFLSLFPYVLVYTHTCLFSERSFSKQICIKLWIITMELLVSKSYWIERAQGQQCNSKLNSYE